MIIIIAILSLKKVVKSMFYKEKKESFLLNTDEAVRDNAFFVTAKWMEAAKKQSWFKNAD